MNHGAAEPGLPTESRLRKGRLLYVALDLRPPGGGRCVGASALEALSTEWDITVLCSEAPDFAGLNRHFGTALDAGAFRILRLPWLVRQVHRFDSDPYSFQAAALLMRISRRIGGNYDVILGADNELDYGRPGIQYVHYPYLAMHRRQVEELEALSPAGRIAAFFRGRYRPWMLISGIRFSRVQSNLFLVNSAWTAKLVDSLYPVQSVVLYPPVRWPADIPPWTERRDAFVILGRVEPVKRQIEAIAIMEAVRSRGYNVGLEVIGDIADRDYARALETRAAAAGPWVKLHFGVTRGELEQIVHGCRYGLHAMRDEHFGIAVAELVRAGCVVFVPDGGGQVEITGDEPALHYRSEDEAVDRICRVLGDPAEQERLQTAMAGRRELFSEKRFATELRRRVREFAAEQAR